MNLLTMEHITKAYTDRVLLNDVAFSINENEKIGVIGINGMGKSTLLKVAAGIEPYDEGKISIGNQVKICYLPQTPEFEEGTTVLRAAIADNVNELNQWTIEADARSMLNKLGFYDYDEKVEHMSGGQKKRIALVNALLTPADILVLDEPTNHLDNAMSEWLEEYLIGFRGAILMVTHDRYFLDRVVRRLFVYDGTGHINQFEGSYTDYYLEHGSFANSAKSVSDTECAGKANITASRKNTPSVTERSDTSKKEAAPKRTKTKLSFNEQREYDNIENDIMICEEKIDGLDREIAAAATDFTKLNHLMAEKESAEMKLEHLMDRYVYLTDLVESFKKSPEDHA